jgi:type III pantothenate kinase
MLVADVGNSRIKWGLCDSAGVDRAASLSDDPDAWREQLLAWQIAAPTDWILAGVDPDRRDKLADWLQKQGHRVTVISHFSQLSLAVEVDTPETVGLDRLLNALAAKARLARGGPAVIVDAGTAVTVDLLNEDGAFVGGSIFPGLRLMAEALHDYTAQLPLVKVTEYPTIVPARSTPTAIAAGVYWAVVGGVTALVRELSLAVLSSEPLDVFITGGDASVIAHDLVDRQLCRYEVLPLLTLEGLRLTAATK